MRNSVKNDTNLINTRWDLSALYKSIDDEKIDVDIEQVEKMALAFPKRFKGQLSEKLEPALKDIIVMQEISEAMFAYLYLMSSRDAENELIKQKLSVASERLSVAMAGMAFFDIELGAMTEDVYMKQLETSPLLMQHKPYLDKIRQNAKYNLSETEETLLTKISPFTSAEWDDMMDEMETKLRFRLPVLGGLWHKTYNMSEILNIANASHSAKNRKKALDKLNKELADSNYLSLRVRALNLLMGEKNMLDRERGFEYPMQGRNISNNLDKETVEALHKTVLEYGSVQGKRYYKILKKLLGKDVLAWADRNAPLPFESKAYYSWDDCVKTVLGAYRKFSPKLEALIKDSFANHRIDAPVYQGKTSGAYNYTIVAEGGKVLTYTFLNYMGTVRDVMTLAHELGHSVHGQLAGAKQGVLQTQAPMAYAETASIFGEMLTFEYMLEQIKDKREKLALLLMKANDWINSVNRQISFSFFEQEVHNRRSKGKLTTSDFNNIWVKVSKDMYGEDGELFHYDNMENLWSYVGHFMRPFYVYAYAFGELFTQSLFAVKSRTPREFEKLYIEMLESGSTKNAVELMAPFGLDPRKADFWRQGIDVSIKKWLDEAEKIIMELGL